MKYRFPAGHNMQLGRDWSFHALIKDGVKLDWSCDSHRIQDGKNGSDVILNAHVQHAKMDRDVTLDVEAASAAPSPPAPLPQGERGEVARFSSAVHEGANYLMLRYRPTLTGQPQRQRRDWVFLFEASADRDP